MADLMKAAVVHGPDQVPRYETFADPGAASPEAGGVLVDVLAAALSPRVRSGASGRHYTSQGLFPLVPGLDGVGRLSDGRRVYFFAADEARGTMAERTLADPRLLAPLPEGADTSLVAAALLPAISSWAALTLRARVGRGGSVLVLGATGTSGQLAVQIAKHLGAARVVAAGRDAAALERLRALGADDVVRLTGTDADGDAVAAAASEVDVVLDYLWGTVTSAVMPALCRRRQAESRALRWVLIGSMAGDDLALSSVLLRKRNLQLLGSGQGASSTEELFSVAPAIIAALATGALRTDLREAPLAEVAQLWSAKLPSGQRLVFIPR